jgi:hypothetical protein
MAGKDHSAGSITFAKSLIQAAIKEGIIKPKVTVEELLSIIPADSEIAPAGGVVAWSGYFVVYPKMTDQSS